MNYYLKIKIKPLSVNVAWKGRRFKTDEYKAYEEALMYLLPPMSVPKKRLKLSLLVGFSSKLSDLSNCLKLFEDILQKRYEFNDKDVFEIHMEKEIVKKGEEYISYKIEQLSLDRC